ncbi:DUF124-domain-containing protein [Cladochytrium replicatum]|nr:DUF124-domain-containing protein [Cladochytrium replicatum]
MSYAPPPHSPSFAPPPGAPPAGQFAPQATIPPQAAQPVFSGPYGVSSPVPASSQVISGYGHGVSYEILHRDVNTLLKLTLQPNVTIKTRAGAMVAHSMNVKLEGKVKLTNFFKSGDVMQQSLTALNSPGLVYLAPDAYADVMVLEISPQTGDWIVGDRTLAWTTGVTKTAKAQSFGNALMSGEGLFVTRVSGQGLVFVTALGGIHPIDLQPNEEFIIDNGHLVAWHASTQYTSVSAGGGLMNSMISGEGRVLKFRGPGRVFIQTRNPQALAAWIASLVPSS